MPKSNPSELACVAFVQFRRYLMTNKINSHHLTVFLPKRRKEWEKIEMHREGPHGRGNGGGVILK